MLKRLREMFIGQEEETFSCQALDIMEEARDKLFKLGAYEEACDLSFAIGYFEKLEEELPSLLRAARLV